MAATVHELLTDALYMSGIVAREDEVPTQSQINDALKQLNAVLSMKQTDMALNPYYDVYPLTAVINQEAYDIDNLIGIETITYTFNDLRYSMAPCGRDAYFGSMRVNNIATFPEIYFCEQQVGGCKLYMWPLPNAAYEFEIHAKFRLSSVTQFQDLTTIFDANYRDYLMIATAKRICTYQGFAIPQNLSDLESEVEAAIRNLMAPVDYSVKVSSTLSRRRRAGSVVNPALSQFYQGWNP